MKKSFLIYLIFLIFTIGIFTYAYSNKNIVSENSDQELNNNFTTNEAYFVYGLIDDNNDKVSLYRYGLKSAKKELIYSFTLLTEQQKPEFYKYADNNILIKRAETYSYSKLIDLNGREIIDYYKELNTYDNFLFSPDNKKVAIDIYKDENYYFKIHNLITNEDILIPWGSINEQTGYLVPEKWGKDNDIVYASVVYPGDLIVSGLYIVDIVNKEIEPIEKTKELNMIQLSLDKDYNVYGISSENFNPRSDEYVKSIYKYNIETNNYTKYELKNTSVSWLGDVDNSGTKIFYSCPINNTTADLCYYDFETDREKRITQNKIIGVDQVFWFENNIIYLNSDDYGYSLSLSIYNTDTNEEKVIFENDGAIEVKIVDVFN